MEAHRTSQIITETTNLLRHRPFEPKCTQNVKRILSLADLCSNIIVMDSSTCQLARYTLPGTLMVSLVSSAFRSYRDRALTQLLRGWPYPDLVLCNLCPQINEGRRGLLSTMHLPNLAVAEYRCLRLLFSALATDIPAALKHIDLTGFSPLMAIIEVKKERKTEYTFAFSKEVKWLRDIGLQVSIDSYINSAYITSKNKLYHNLSLSNYSRRLVIEGRPSNLQLLGDKDKIDPNLLTKVSAFFGEGSYQEPVDFWQDIQCLRDLVNVKELTLSGCPYPFRQFDIPTHTMETLSDVLNQMGKLNSLDLCYLLNKGSLSILLGHLEPQILSRISYLKLTHFNESDIECLITLPNIKHLNLFDQPDDTKYIEAFRRVLPKLKELEVLHLSYTSLTEQEEAQLVATFRMCDKLQHVIVPELAISNLQDFPSRIELYQVQDY